MDLAIGESPPASVPPSPHGIHVTRLFRRAARLAVVGDPRQSLLLPFLLLIPWFVLESVLPDAAETPMTLTLLLLRSGGTVGGLVTSLIVNAALRLRAWEAAAGSSRAPLDDYARALGRTPALLLTEIVRTVAVGAAAVFLFVPGIYLLYRLSVATEAVVLRESSMGAAFQASFLLTRRSFGPWMRMLLTTAVWWVFALIAASILYFVATQIGWIVSPSLIFAPFFTLMFALAAYAWTFYYLELGARAEGEAFLAQPSQAAWPPPGAAPSPSPAQNPPPAPGAART